MISGLSFIPLVSCVSRLLLVYLKWKFMERNIKILDYQVLSEKVLGGGHCGSIEDGFSAGERGRQEQ